MSYPTINLAFSNTSYNVNVVPFPAAADSSGSVGDIAYSNGYIAICLATDTWYFFPASAVRPSI